MSNNSGERGVGGLVDPDAERLRGLAWDLADGLFGTPGRAARLLEVWLRFPLLGGGASLATEAEALFLAVLLRPVRVRVLPASLMLFDTQLLAIPKSAMPAKAGAALLQLQLYGSGELFGRVGGTNAGNTVFETSRDPVVYRGRFSLDATLETLVPRLFVVQVYCWFSMRAALKEGLSLFRVQYALCANATRASITAVSDAAHPVMHRGLAEMDRSFQHDYQAILDSVLRDRFPFPSPQLSSL